jgi:uncharacterized membrane protein YkvA (DUF1232 family)
MSEFIELLKILIIANSSLAALWLILIALPGSHLRNYLLQLYSKALYLATGLALVYIVNPIDLIPDIIPLFGQADDAVAVVSGIVTATFGWLTAYSQTEIKNN